MTSKESSISFHPCGRDIFLRGACPHRVVQKTWESSGQDVEFHEAPFLLISFGDSGGKKAVTHRWYPRKLLHVMDLNRPSANDFVHLLPYFLVRFGMRNQFILVDM